MTPSRKTIVGAIASAVAALTLLGGTAASAADAPKLPAKQTQGSKATGTSSNPTPPPATPRAWKPR